MAVYIKNMKMPKKCANCLLCDERTDRCAVTLKQIEDFCRVDDDCPLVAVPDHGDLIEANSLKIRLGQRFSLDERRIMEIVRETVDTAKVAIPAERSKE